MENYSVYFKDVVENIFNRWTALKLAVEHGMGGFNGHQKAIDVMNYIADYCLQTDKLTNDELIDVLEDIMDQEFETICQDNSIQEISMYLIKFLAMCKTGQFVEINNELAHLPPMTRWLTPGHKITYIAVQNNSSEDDDDENNDTIKDNSVTITNINSNFGPSASGSTTNAQMEEEDIDPGWTVVKSTRKRK